MSQFSPDDDSWAPEATEDAPSGRAASRPLVTLVAAGSAVLLAIGAWVVLTGGDEELLDSPSPVAVDPFVSAPLTPGRSDGPTIDPTAPILDPGAGRDPFVPLVTAQAAPAATVATGSPIVMSPAQSPPTATPTPTPTPAARPTPTPTATPKSVPAGKKKSIPTTGPVL
jgi:hypothetical protein